MIWGPQPSKPATFIEADVLQRTQYDALKWMVEGFLPEGLTLFAGKPKAGKSYMCLQFAIAIASGAKIFGVQCTRRGVIYAALEDNERRLQSRMEELRDDQGFLPLLFTTDLNRGKIGIQELEQQMDRYKSRGIKIKSLIIDTLTAFREHEGKKQDRFRIEYDDLVPLRDLCNRHKVSALVVHHTNKSQSDDPDDLISGTRGLAAAPDAIITLTASDKPEQFVFQGKGRDLQRFSRLAWFDRKTSTWSVSAGEPEAENNSTDAKVIIDAIASSNEGQLKPSELVSITGFNRNKVNRLLMKLRAGFKIQRTDYGLYRLTMPHGYAQFSKTVNTVNT